MSASSIRPAAKNEPESTTHGYAKILLGLRLLFAVIGAVLGTLLLFHYLKHWSEPSVMDRINGTDSRRGGARMYGAPILFAIGGYFYGLMVGILFAPTSFYESTLGKYWLNKMCCRSPIWARLLAIAWLIIPVAICIWLWWFYTSAVPSR